MFTEQAVHDKTREGRQSVWETCILPRLRLQQPLAKMSSDQPETWGKGVWHHHPSVKTE